jgi:hypothetical protein
MFSFNMDAVKAPQARFFSLPMERRRKFCMSHDDFHFHLNDLFLFVFVTQLRVRPKFNSQLIASLCSQSTTSRAFDPLKEPSKADYVACSNGRGTLCPVLLTSL